MVFEINKQKMMSSLGLIGAIFILLLIIGYYVVIQNRGEVVASKVELSKAFREQFSSVDIKNRTKTIPSTPFMTPKGEMTDWEDFKGSYTLVNFWASWCAPCVTELPSLDKLGRKYRDKGLKVIGISLDLMKNHQEIKSFLANKKIGQFAAYFDSNQNIQKRISMRGVPTTYLLDKEGQITHVFEGDADWDSPSAQNFFNYLLNEKL